MQAKTVVDVVLGEAVHGTRAERLEDMKAIASVIYNRAGGDVLSMQDVVKGRGQFGAYGKSLPPGAEAYRDLAEQAIREVVNNGPTTAATYYATPAATGNLPGGLKTETRTKGHVFKSDPQNRPIVAAKAERSTASPLGIEPRGFNINYQGYRQKPVDRGLLQAATVAADRANKATGKNYSLEFFSGGQPPEYAHNPKLTGGHNFSTRHNIDPKTGIGRAVDVRIFDGKTRVQAYEGDGRAWSKEFAKAAGELGIGGFGTYGARDNTFHLDLVPRSEYRGGQGPTWGPAKDIKDAFLSGAGYNADTGQFAVAQMATGSTPQTANDVAALSPVARKSVSATDFLNRMPAPPVTQTASMLGGVPLGAPGARGAPALPQITRENAPPPTAASMLPTRGPNWTPPPLGTSAMMQPTPQPLGPPGQRNLTPREMGRFVPAMPQTVPSHPSASIGLSMQPVGARGMPTQPPAPPLSAPREVGAAPHVAETPRVPMEWAGPPGAATQAGAASVLDPLGVLSPGTVRDEAARLVAGAAATDPYMRAVTAAPKGPGRFPTAPRREGQGGAPMSGPAPGQTTSQAIQGIISGKAPAGYSVRSASNPDVTITSLGPMGYAHTNSRYAWSQTYGPDGSKTFQPGRAVTVTTDPETGNPTISYYTPKDDNWGYGLSPGLRSRRSTPRAPTTFSPSMAFKSPARGILAGLASLFAPPTPVAMRAVPVAPVAPVVAAGSVGAGAGPGAGGGFAGYGGVNGFSGAFSEGAHSNSTSSRGL